MIKRLLTTGLVLAGMVAANAQNLQVKGFEPMQISKEAVYNAPKQKITLPPMVDGDTLAYFINKHEARNTGTIANAFSSFQLPQPAGFANIQEVGSSFLNPGNATITVYGAMALCLRHATSTSTTVPLRVYIYSANGGGTPLAKLDSAMTSVTQSTIGSYCLATFSNPVTVTSAFFISYKPVSLPTDTIRYFVNNAFSPTGTLNPSTQRYGEGLSYTRVAGNWALNTNNLYGAGTDRENLVVPTVAFQYSAGALVPPTNTTSPTGHCANLAVTFTSTSMPTSIIDNRQFNWNAFVPAWLPFVNTQSATPTVMRQGENVYNWTWNTGTLQTTATGSMPSVAFANPGVTSGNLVVKYQHSCNFGTTSKTQNVSSPAMTMTIVNCGIVGVNENFMDMNVSLFPNPAINGKTNIKGLVGKNNIAVYNMIGQQVFTLATENEVQEIDLSSQPAGTYMIKVTDSSNRSKAVKVIKE